MIPSNAASPRSRIRPFAIVGAMVVAGVVVGALAARLLQPSPSPSSSPPADAVWWRLTGGPESVVADGEAGAPRLDETSVQTTTEIPIVTYYPWPGGLAAPDDSWLGTPTITYTPSAVIITMHVSVSFTCGPPMATTKRACGWSLEPRYVQKPVHLSEPLGGRALFDGSTNPPQQRWFPWSRAASIDSAAVKAMYTDACNQLVLDALLCAQVKIEGMTAESRTLAVPTTLGPADKDRADAICHQMALAHVDVDPKVPGYEKLIRIVGLDGGGLTACSIP